MKTVWKWIRTLFTRERVAKVWKILFNGMVTVTVSILTNEELMNAAFEISLGILGVKDVPLSKQTMFNMKMNEWCAKNGLSSLTPSQMNVVREIAYAAVKAQTEADEIRRRFTARQMLKGMELSR